MGGKQSKQTDTSQSTGTPKEDALSKLPEALIGHISEYLTPEEEARLKMVKPALKRSERDALSPYSAVKS